jgi:hypothetical protein
MSTQVNKLRFTAVVKMKNDSHKTCDIIAEDIKEAAAKIRRKYPNHCGFELAIN